MSVETSPGLPQFQSHPEAVIGPYRVSGGLDQLVGREGKGLIAQVCVQHVLENSPAVGETGSGDSQGHLGLQGEPGLGLAGEGTGLHPCTQGWGAVTRVRVMRT